MTTADRPPPTDLCDLCPCACGHPRWNHLDGTGECSRGWGDRLGEGDPCDCEGFVLDSRSVDLAGAQRALEDARKMRDHALHRLQQIRAALGPLVDGYASLEDAVRGLVEDRGRLCAELAEARAEFAAIDEALGLGGEGRTRWQGQRVAEIRDWIERWRRSHVEARDLHEQLAAIECVRCGESAEPESSEALRPSGMCGQCERAAAVRPDPLERIAAAAETIARVARGVRP